MAESQSTAGYYFDADKGRFRIQIQRTLNGRKKRRTRLLPAGTTEQEAGDLANAMRIEVLQEVAGLAPNANWERNVARALENRQSWIHAMLKGAKQRSKKKGRELTITPEEIAALALESRGRCAVSGIAFSQGTYGTGKMRPFAPSLDRMDGTKGYTKENCRLVCSAINVAMFTWGAEAFKSIAVGYVVNQILAKEAEIFRLKMGEGWAPFLHT